MKCYAGIYFLFVGSSLLYIGSSSSVRRRLAEHNRKGIYTHFSVSRRKQLQEAREAEQAMIYKYEPANNHQIFGGYGMRHPFAQATVPFKIASKRSRNGDPNWAKNLGPMQRI